MTEQRSTFEGSFVPLNKKELETIDYIRTNNLVSSILHSKIHQVFKDGLILLFQGTLPPVNTFNSLLIKKHLEKLLIGIYWDFWLYGFSVLIKVREKVSESTEHLFQRLDIRALDISVRARFNSSFLSNSSLDYVIKIKKNQQVLQNCTVLEHPLYAPVSTGRMSSPLASLIVPFFEYREQKELYNSVLRAHSKINVFFEDRPEMITSGLLKDSSESRSEQASLPEAMGQVLWKTKKTTEEPSVGPAISFLAHSQEEAARLRLQRLHSDVYSRLHQEHNKDLYLYQNKVEEEVAVFSIRAPKGTQIRHIQMPSFTVNTSRPSRHPKTDEDTGGTRLLTTQNYSLVDDQFDFRVMQALRVEKQGRNWEHHDDPFFDQQILQFTINSLINSQQSSFTKYITQEIENRLDTELTSSSNNAYYEKYKDVLGPLGSRHLPLSILSSFFKKIEGENNLSSTPPFIIEQEVLRRAQLLGIDTHEWSLVFNNLYTHYTETDDGSLHSIESQTKEINNTEEDPNYETVQPYKRRKKATLVHNYQKKPALSPCVYKRKPVSSASPQDDAGLSSPSSTQFISPKEEVESASREKTGFSEDS